MRGANHGVTASEKLAYDALIQTQLCAFFPVQVQLLLALC